MAKNKRPQPVSNAPKPSRAVSPQATYSGFNWTMTGVQLLLFLMVVVLFSSAAKNDFVSWDDHVYVFENQYILNPTWAGFKQFATSVVSLNYHPLTMWTLWLNAKLFGSGAGSFIVTNILLHAVNAVLAFRLAWQLSGKNIAVGLITALLFSIHPLRVESVVWVSERKDVLYVCFFFLSCLSYLRYLDSGAKKWFWWAFLCFLLSCLSKAMAVVLPVVLLLLDYWKKRPIGFKLLTEKSVFFACALLFGLIALNVQGGGDFYGLFTVPSGTRDNAVGAGVYNMIDKLRFAGYGYWQYWQNFFIPTNLCTFYPYPEAQNISKNLLFSIGPLFLIANIVSILYFWNKKPLVSFSLAFMLVTIALVLQILQVGLVIRADRYTYLPHFGLAFLISYGINQWINSVKPDLKWAFWGLIAVFTGYMAVLTTKQISTWRDSETLWLNVLKFYPEEDLARETLGNWYGKNNRIQDATQQLEAATANGSKRPRVYSTLANCYAIQENAPGRDTTGRWNRFAKINDLYQKAIDLEPDNGVHYLDRVATFYGLRPAQSLVDLENAQPLVTEDKIINLRGLRGMCLLNLKKYAEAKAELDGVVVLCEQMPASKRSVPVTQQLSNAYRNRGIARFYLQDRSGALADLQASLKVVPNDPTTLNVIKQIEQQPQQ